MVSFTLPVIPTAQARPRFSKWGTYKSALQKANERPLEAWLLEHTPKTPLEGTLSLEFVAALPLSKSVSKKRRRLYMGASLGNGWTVDVVAHIFNCIESANEAKATT